MYANGKPWDYLWLHFFWVHLFAGQTLLCTFNWIVSGGYSLCLVPCASSWMHRASSPRPTPSLQIGEINEKKTQNYHYSLLQRLLCLFSFYSYSHFSVNLLFCSGKYNYQQDVQRLSMTEDVWISTVATRNTEHSK